MHQNSPTLPPTSSVDEVSIKPMGFLQGGPEPCKGWNPGMIFGFQQNPAVKIDMKKQYTLYIRFAMRTLTYDQYYFIYELLQLFFSFKFYYMGHSGLELSFFIHQHQIFGDGSKP